MKDHYDAIVIGGGHNGLTCAAYLARAGLTVAVIERRPLVGGACVTEELLPGAFFSSCAFIQAKLHPRVIADLELAKYGLEMYAPNPQNFVLADNGEYFRVWHSIDQTLRELARVDRRDAKRFLRFGARMRRFGQIMAQWSLRVPPQLSAVAESFSQLGERDLYAEFIDGSTSSILSRYFRSQAVRGFLTFFGVVSIWGGPKSPGTGFLLGYHSSGEYQGVFGRWAFPRGGMGAISNALQRSAEAYGAEVFVNSEVQQVVIESGRATGVELKDGRHIRARVVASNASDAPESVAAPSAVPAVDRRGSVGRVHLLVTELPKWKGVPESELSACYAGHQLLGCSEEYFERAHEAMLAGSFLDRLALEVTTQSVHEPDLAPAGSHTLTLGVLNLPFNLAAGTWDTRREEFTRVVLESLFHHAPNLRGRVAGVHVITPLDLERTYGLRGGNIFHVAMTRPHLFDGRPYQAASDYRTPTKQLYLCGSSAHPGGGVSGVPGHNAAQEILRDLGRATASLEPDPPSRFDLATRFLSTDPGLLLAYVLARTRVFNWLLGFFARR